MLNCVIAVTASVVIVALLMALDSEPNDEDFEDDPDDETPEPSLTITEQNAHEWN